MVAGLDHGGADWVCSDILVKIVPHYEDSGLADKQGQIRSVSGPVCNVFVEDLQRVVGITIENLEPITPERGDKVTAECIMYITRTELIYYG